MLLAMRIIYFFSLLFSAFCSYATLNNSGFELLGLASTAYPYMTAFMPVALVIIGISGIFLYISISGGRSINYDGFFIVTAGVIAYIMESAVREGLPYVYFTFFWAYVIWITAIGIAGAKTGK